MNKKKIITRNILLLSLVSFFTDMSSEMLYPIMPLFFASVGLGAAGIGAIEGTAEAVAGISKSYFGHLGDKLGRPEWFVRIGYALSAFSKPLLGFVGSTSAFIAVRSADRFGKGIRTAPRDAILAVESDKSVRGRVFGFHRSLDTFGAAIGPLIAIGIIAGYGLYDDLSKVFLFALIPGIAAVGLTFMVKSSFKKSAVNLSVLKQATRSYAGIFRPSLYTPEYRKLVLALVFVGIFNSTDAFLLLRASELLGSREEIFGITLENAIVVIALYVLYNIVYALLSLVTGSLADKRGFRNTYIIGLIGFIVAYGMLSRDISLGYIAIAFSIYALFSSVNDAVVKAWISKQLPKESLGTGLGVANTLVSLTFLISSVVTGILWQTVSPNFALSVLSIGMILPIAYLLIAIPAKEAPPRQTTD